MLEMGEVREGVVRQEFPQGLLWPVKYILAKLITSD